MPSEEKEKQTQNEEKAIRKSEKTPLIFISHDNRDAELAEAFSKLLSSVSAGVLKSFRSSDRKGSQGIEYGVEWYPELMTKLEDASDVVCMLTKRSVERPWILYEAGVAKGKLDKPVFGIALGIPLNKASTGPFAQFQNCDDDSESLTKLVMQLVKRIPGSEPDHDAIKMQVESFKQKVSELLKTMDSSKDKADTKAMDETSVAKLFEEIKLMFRDLPTRIEDIQSDKSDPRRRKKIRRFHPMLFEEIFHFADVEKDEPVGLLFFISLFKDDFPWLFEAGMELYRSIKTGKVVQIRSSLKSFYRLIEFTTRGPFMEEFMYSDKEAIFFFREFPHIIERYTERILSKKQIKQKQ